MPGIYHVDHVVSSPGMWPYAQRAISKQKDILDHRFTCHEIREPYPIAPAHRLQLKKVTKTPQSLRERERIDYDHKLSDADRAWLEKFNAEMRGEFPKSRNRGLVKGIKKRRKIWDEVNAARRDIQSAHPQQVKDAVEQRTDHSDAQKSKNYSASDYCQETLSPEDHLIDVIDRCKREKNRKLS